MTTLHVNKNDSEQRIDKYIRKFLNNAPLSFIYKLFRKKDIKVNGKKVNIDYIVKENDSIDIYLKDDLLDSFNKPQKLEIENIKLDIVYEDQNILIINKDANVLVHEGNENRKANTLNNMILNYLFSKNEYVPSDLYTPSCVHRLDRNTSGLILASKNLETSKLLLELFKDKEKLTKCYLALVKGIVSSNGTINKKLLKDEKKKYVKVDENGLTAITKYEKLASNDTYSLLKVQLLTGRTHQIRVHLASINHPVINDEKYGDYVENKRFSSIHHYTQQLLHSYSLTFTQMPEKLKYLEGKTFIAPLKHASKQVLLNLFKEEIINEL